MFSSISKLHWQTYKQNYIDKTPFPYKIWNQFALYKEKKSLWDFDWDLGLSEIDEFIWGKLAFFLRILSTGRMYLFIYVGFSLILFISGLYIFSYWYYTYFVKYMSKCSMFCGAIFLYFSFNIDRSCRSPLYLLIPDITICVFSLFSLISLMFLIFSKN